jgi:hypothetical protein
MQLFDRADEQTGRETGLRSGPLLALCALLWCTWANQLWSSVEQSRGIDFYDYYTASHALGQRPLVEGSALYSVHMRQQLGIAAYRDALAAGTWRQLEAAQAFPTLEPTSSPYTYTMWRLILQLPYDDSYRFVQAVSLLLFVCALFGLGRLLGLSLGLTAVLGLAVSSDSIALASDVRVCNVNRLLVCGLTIFLWLRAQAHSASLAGRGSNVAWQLASGAWIACMVAFKPVVGSMLTLTWIAALCRGERRDCALQSAGVALGVAGAVAISTVYFGGLSAWTRWLSSITTTLSDEVTTVWQGNYAPARVLEVIWPHFPFRTYGSALAGLLLVVVVLIHLRAPRTPLQAQSVAVRARNDMLLLGLGFAFTLFTSRLVWLHWQLLLIPTMFALAPCRVVRRPAELVHVLLWLSAALLMSESSPLRFLNLEPAFGTAGAVLTADVLLAGLCVAGIWKARSVGPLLAS